MTSQEIRKIFIDYFKDKNHTYVPSAPVVPHDDPTLLFTNAGMNQFKDILLGKGKRAYTRAVNSQKCIRVSGKHNDLEEVGHDTYHHTFFEMLGNWSFGDYYKEDAITWAWELFTDVFKLPKEKIYATVFREDDEAAELWAKLTDIDAKKILRFDEKDNFWEMGDTGPCGPCSEIHIDLGPDRCDKQGTEHTCFVNGDCGRYIELWNLVFIQYNREEDGQLKPLPNKHVDTGAGFERLVSVMQNAASNYDTDLFTPILDHIGRIIGTPYAESKEQIAFRVIADHVRMLTFSIADGAFPSNEGRGYVMRRILRRAARYGRKLNMHEPFIYQLVPTVAQILGDTFPEAHQRAEHVATVIKSEEEHFNRTLDRGLEIFEKIKAELQQKKEIVIAGSDVFRLYDTYGFPVDLTRVLADESGLKLDTTGFDQEMKAQQDRARKAAQFKTTGISADDWTVLTDVPGSRFVGYSEDAIETHIIKYSVQETTLHLVLKETPFYAESGGQVGDHGIVTIDGVDYSVTDTQKDGDDFIHLLTVPAGFKIKSDRVFAEIITANRRETEKNHTATHLLHSALRQTLGEHVQQAGSLVEPERLRFDFTHFSRVTDEQLTQIESIVNAKIQEDMALEIAQDSYDNARKRGAMALFGEKYGDVVRTVRVGEFSLELCGGTHVRQTGQIGPFVITSESSIASGVRRIEAITGAAAVKFMQESRASLQQIGELLNARDTELVAKIQDLLDDRRQLEKKISKLNADLLSSGMDSVLAGAQKIGDVTVIIHKLNDSDMDQLKDLGDKIREKTSGTIALLGTVAGDKLAFVCTVSDDLVKSGKYKAGDLIREIAKVAGGGGGGKPHLATAGGKDVNRFDEAMNKIKELI